MRRLRPPVLTTSASAYVICSQKTRGCFMQLLINANTVTVVNMGVLEYILAQE